MEYYLSIKNKDTRKFEGKWTELETKISLSEATKTEKDKHGIYSLISRYYLQNRR